MNTEKYYDLICCMLIDDVVRIIMGQKKNVGEFSMDLYYDDIARSENVCFVAKLFFPGGEVEDTYYRCRSFRWCLAHVVETFANMGTDIVERIKERADEVLPQGVIEFE